MTLTSVKVCHCGAIYWYELPASVSVAQETTENLKHALHCLAFVLTVSASSINLMTPYTRFINLSLLCVLIKVCGVFFFIYSVFWSILVCFDLELVCFGQV